MSNGDYPLGAKDDSSAPYHVIEYTRHVTIFLETDITIESGVTLTEDEIYDRIKEGVKDEIYVSYLDYDFKDISIQ